MMRLLVLLLGLMMVAHCDNIQLHVWTPPEFAKSLSEDTTATKNVSIGNFGHIPWGKMVIGNVYLAPKVDGCDPYQHWDINKADPHPIAIVKRGGCNFVHKALNAQIAGAQMLIIINDHPALDVEMVDDTSGQSAHLTIPTILVTSITGGKIWNVTEEGHKVDPPRRNHTVKSRVGVSISFEISKKDKPVYEIWLSSSDRHSYQIIDNFWREYHYLKDAAEMKIRTVIKQYDFHPYTKPQKNCVSGGRYCATHAIADKNYDGMNNILEDIRQHCVFEKRKDKFHDYMEKYGRNCFDKIHMQLCSDQNLKELGINSDEINTCINATFVRAGNDTINYALDDNTYLHQELTDSIAKGVVTWPTAFVNGIAIKGTLNAANLFETICLSMKTPVHECGYKHWDEKDKTSHKPEDYKKSSAFLIVLFVIIGLLVLFVLVFYFVYRRIVKQQLARELSLSVNSAVANYVKMNEGRQA